MIWWYESYIQGSSTASVCTIRCSRIPSQTNPDGLSLTYTHSVQCSKYSLCSKMFVVPEYHRIPTSVWYVRCVRYLVSNGGGGRRPGVMVGEWSHWSHYIPPPEWDIQTIHLMEYVRYLPDPRPATLLLIAVS